MKKKNYVSILIMFLITFFINNFVAPAQGSDLKESIKELENYVIASKQSTKLQELFNLCGESYKNGDYQRVKECAKKILLIDPENREAKQYIDKIRQIDIDEKKKEKTRQAQLAKEAKQAEKLRKQEQRAAELAAQRKQAQLQAKREATQAKLEAEKAGLWEPEGFQAKIGKLDQLLAERSLKEKKFVERQKEFKLQLMSIKRDKELVGNAVEDIYSALEKKEKTKQNLLWQENETATEIVKTIAEQKNTEKSILDVKNSLKKERQILEKLEEKAKPARLGLLKVNFEITNLRKRISGIEKSIKLLENDFFNKQQDILKAKEKKDRAFLKIFSKEKAIQEEIGILKNNISREEQGKEISRQEKASKNVARKFDLSISQISAQLNQEENKQDELTRKQTGIEEELRSLNTEKESITNRIADSTASLAQAEEKLTLLKKDEQAHENKLSRLTSQCRESQQKIVRLNRLIDKARVQEAEIVSEEEKPTSRLDLLQKELQTFKNKDRDLLTQRKQAQEEQSQALEGKKAFNITLSGVKKNIELIALSISQISSWLNQEKNKQDELTRKQTGIEEELRSLNIEKEAFANRIADSTASLAQAEEKLTLLKKDEQARENKLSQCRESEQKIVRLSSLLKIKKDAERNIILQERSMQDEIFKLSLEEEADERIVLAKLTADKEVVQKEIVNILNELSDEKIQVSQALEGKKAFNITLSGVKKNIELIALSISQISSWLNQEKNKQDELTRKQTGIEEELRSLNIEKEAFANRIAEDITFLAEAEEKFTFLKAELEPLVKNRENIRVEIETIFRSFNQEKSFQNKLSLEKSALTEEIAALTRQQQGLKGTIKAKERGLKGCRAKTDKLIQKQQSLKSGLKHISISQRELQAKINRLQKDLAQEKLDKKKEISRQKKAFKARLDDLRKDERVIQTETEAAASHMVNFTRRLEELTIQKKDFEGKVNQLVREEEIIKGNIAEVNKLIQGQKMKAIGLGKKQEQFEFEISEKEVKIDEAQKNIITSSKSLEKRETVLKKLKEKEKVAQAKVLKIRENLKEIEKEMGLIQNDLEAAKGNHKNIKEQEVSINTELGNLKTSLTIVRKRLIDLSEEKWNFEMGVLEDKRKKEFGKIEKAEREVARANQEMVEILSEKRKKMKRWESSPMAKDEERLIYHYSRAFELDYSERYDEAAVEYEEVLRINPNYADAHYNLALIYGDHLNEKRKAIQHYREYLELKPAAEDASQVAGWIIDALKGLEWDSWN